MRNELKNIERIELYITNQLSEMERLSFEQEMSRNTFLVEQVEAHSLLLQAIRRKELRSEIKAIGGGTSLAKWKFWGLGGAFLIVLIFAFLLKNNQLYDLAKINNDKVEAVEESKQILSVVKIDSLETTELFIEDSIVQGNKKGKKSASVNHKSKPIVYKEDTECGGLKTFVAPDIQHFEVDATKGKTIEGKQGTLVIIPSNAFLDSLNQAVVGTVDFELVEALTLEDMVLYNLTTTSNGKLLETGGMFYMNATQNGKTLKINPKRPIYTETPTETKKKGMLAFDSEIDSLGNINWINPKPLKKYLTKIDLDLLDFLPNGFANGVEGALPYKNYKKSTPKLVDSLYYSLDDIGSKEEFNVFEVTADGTSKRPNIIKKKISSIAYLAKEVTKRRSKQETGLIAGNIIDKMRDAISNAQIVVKLGDVKHNTYSDLNGDYNVFNIIPGTYLLEVYHNKFEKYTEEVLIVNGTTTIPQIRLKERSNFPCGINPLSIKAIKTLRFEQTYLATKEMEERINELHQLNNGDSLLQVYIENLGGNLFIADSIVMQALSGKEKEIFNAFYQQKLTDLKDVDNIYQKQLSAYYNKKKKQYAKDLNRLKGKFAQKSQKELEELQRSITQNTKEYLKASKPKISPKQILKRSLGSIAQSMPKSSVATTNSYPAQWTTFGWKNIDAYLHLLSKGAETVIITSSKKVGFNRVFQYLNTIKTLTPLLIEENTSLAKFPKRGSKEAKQMQRTYCFNIAKQNGKYYWGKQNFNPYQQSNLTITAIETPLHKIREELKITGRDGEKALRFFEKNIKATIEYKREQAKRMKQVKVDAEKRAELLKIYKAKQAQLKLDIERKKQIRLAEKRFITKLRAIAFPCEKDEVVDEEELTISAPNKFYPNTDGQNSTFIVRVNTKITSYKMVITDNKGKVIYTTTSMEKPWDGRKSNSKRNYSSGFYTWAIKITDAKGKEARYNGVVELINEAITIPKSNIKEQ